jgi:Tfp pilus assembly protein PilX
MPFSLLIALVVLVLLCIIAVGMMARVVSKPSISQTLRLNED